MGRWGPNLRVVVEDVLPSLTKVDKRLPSPIFRDGICEIWKSDGVTTHRLGVNTGEQIPCPKPVEPVGFMAMTKYPC